MSTSIKQTPLLRNLDSVSLGSNWLSIMYIVNTNIKMTPFLSKELRLYILPVEMATEYYIFQYWNMAWRSKWPLASNLIGAGCAAILAKSFFGRSPWLHGGQTTGFLLYPSLFLFLFFPGVLCDPNKDNWSKGPHLRRWLLAPPSSDGLLAEVSRFFPQL